MKPGKLLLIESCVKSKCSCIKYGLKDTKYYTEYISYCILTYSILLSEVDYEYTPIFPH